MPPLVLVLLSALPLSAANHRSSAWARSQFDSAEKLHQALESRPEAQRSRHDYQQVIEAYRRIYYAAPASGKADASVAATAGLTAELGRRFGDEAALRKAIGEYQFLRREYPGSKYRLDALLGVGEIYHNGLHDAAMARSAFQQFLQRYPNSRRADEARAKLAQLNEPVPAKPIAPAAEATVRNEDTPSPVAGSAPPEKDRVQAGDGKPALVTEIRHWSSPDYTRVIVLLQQGVAFEAQQIENPERIFFDLYDAKLPESLTGKTLDVEDGFLKKIRAAQFSRDRTRVVLELDRPAEYKAALLSNPTRLVIDVRSVHVRSVDSAGAAGNRGLSAAADERRIEDSSASAAAPSARSMSRSSPSVTAVSLPSAQTGKPGVKKTIVEADDDDDSVISPVASSSSPAKLLAPASVRSTDPASERVVGPSTRRGRTTIGPVVIAREARPTAAGERSLIRALGLKIGKIVIDPGHGGHDTGTIGPNGLQEKDLVLDVSMRLGKLLETRLGAEVDYTRRDDTFIPLEARTAMANQEQADLFVSIHANSSHDPDARGVETYYLNFTSSPDALEVAARENAGSDTSIHELQDLVKKIALKEKIEESHEFAADVETSLHSGLAARNPSIRDRGVKKAPFIVLIGANMPSILAEISFVSNPADERRLKTPEYRQRIAESLYRGIARYVNGLSGVKVASKMDKTTAR